MNESSETLEFDGKRYVTSARAAKLFGYTKDYVGQLARGGKIHARLVGRSWYVSEDSVRAHKLETHYVLTKTDKPTTDEIQIHAEKTNNINDISASRSPARVTATPPSKVGGYEHASRELARADVRFEGGQALALDDSYVPPLIQKTRMRDVEGSDTKKEVERVYGGERAMPNIPSHASEDAFPVHLRMAREQRIASREQYMPKSQVRGVVGAGVDGVAVPGVSGPQNRRMYDTREVFASRIAPADSIYPKRVFASESEHSVRHPTPTAPSDVSSASEINSPYFSSEKRIPVLVGLGVTTVFIFLQILF